MQKNTRSALYDRTRLFLSRRAAQSNSHQLNIPLVQYPLFCRFNAIEKSDCEAASVQQLFQLFAGGSIRPYKGRTHKPFAGLYKSVFYFADQFVRNHRFVEDKCDISRRGWAAEYRSIRAQLFDDKLGILIYSIQMLKPYFSARKGKNK